MKSPLRAPSRLPPRRPLLYLITDRRTPPPHQARAAAPAERQEQLAITRQLAAIEAASAAGCQLIQIRERDLGARALGDLTGAAIALARPHGARVLVNDRLDVALGADADGVHLRASSISAAEARAVAARCGRDDFLIGASVHSLEEAEEAAEAADFLVCGPVYETPSKISFGPPLGLELLSQVARAVAIPVLAIGGMKLENFRQPLAAGASGLAAISLFADPATVGERVRRMLSAPEQSTSSRSLLPESY